MIATIGRAHRIALVEDDDSLRERLLLWLSGAHNATGFVSGGAFLTALEELKPELVVLDLCLPGFDGLEIAQRLRAHPRFRQVPIVFLTEALAGEVDLPIPCDRAEALNKPIELEALLGLIDRLLPAKEHPAARRLPP